MKTPANPDKILKSKPKPSKKSVLELAKQIPKDKYKGLSSILEPHEIPDRQ
jgi:hypothetical protein